MLADIINPRITSSKLGVLMRKKLGKNARRLPWVDKELMSKITGEKTQAFRR